MTQFDLATLMGLTFDGRRRRDDGYVMHRYLFGWNEYVTGYLPTDENCETDVARRFFKDFEEIMDKYHSS